MILHIDTKDQKVIKVSLKEKGEVVKSLSKENKYGSQVLLPLIVKLIDKLRTKSFKIPQVSIQVHPKGVHLQSHFGSGIWRQLKGVEVETGPGSFTGLRVGVSLANALGFSLGIPVNGKKIETELKY